MASNKFRYPPAPNRGSDSFSDDIVGLQLVTGGGLTQGNFAFTTSVTQKVNRTFSTVVFSAPITLENLDITSDVESRLIIAKEFGVYPNFDISQVTNFTLYGSLKKRIEVSVLKIINFFPAAIQINQRYVDYTTANTVTNIIYNELNDETSFDLDVSRFLNPFNIDFSINSTRNIEVLPYEVNPLRNFTLLYDRYVLALSGGSKSYPIVSRTSTNTLTAGTLSLVVTGNPFSGVASTTSTVLLRPADYYVNETFSYYFDEVEKFLLNTLTNPIYTATFQIPRLSEAGQFYVAQQSITWPISGIWNLDISSPIFDAYLLDLYNLSEELDTFKTDLISRFLVTGAFKEFDTTDQRVDKVLQIYGRSFDEVRKFIDGLAFITSVNYVPKNDIPSQLLKNLALTLGWDINISPITSDSFLSSIFSTEGEQIYPGMSRNMTPNELNFEYYRKLILNSGYLFRSKGTRRSIEFIMRMIGAPNALLEFNETVYLADGKLNYQAFENQYLNITGGTYNTNLPTLDSGNTYSISGVTYNTLTYSSSSINVNVTETYYPIDTEGYPSTAETNNNYYFQIGSGWYEQTPQHRSPTVVNVSNSVFTGSNPDVQTELAPFTFGQPYLDRYRKFPYMSLGWDLKRVIDNQKSWVYGGPRKRVARDGNYQAFYNVPDDRLVINSKNIEIYLNSGQGLEYDVWDMSVKYNYPIPNSGLTSPYPTPGDIDWTYVDPRPKQKTFFEFAQTFYKNMINVRNRQWITDGKGGGYPTLQLVYWNYLQSQQTVGIPSNQYTYQKMIDYTQGIGDYWMKLVEQMVPATTLWMGGQKFSNSVFHRQKVVWRRQRGCQIVAVEIDGAQAIGQFLGSNCTNEILSDNLYPAIAWTTILSNAYNAAAIALGCTLTPTVLSSIVSTWYVDVKLDSNQLILQSFFTGNGSTEAPTNTDWLNALTTELPALYNYGLNYSISAPTIQISNAGCIANFTNQVFDLSVSINIQLTCS